MRDKIAALVLDDDVPFRLERNLLKDRAMDLLRDHIVSGRIPAGAKLVERDLAQLLGISRAPVRDALIQLETEGLVVSKPNGRYVVELTDRDIRELYQVRLVLEKLAVELAAQSRSPENRRALAATLNKMQEAIARRDRLAYIKHDVEIHRLIWQQSDNSHLYNILNSMVGRIFIFVSSNAQYYDWEETLKVHQDVVGHINAGDASGAIASIQLHMDNALQGALQVFQAPLEVDVGPS